MSHESIDVRFACPYCDQHLVAPSEMAEQAIDCPACGKLIMIPACPNEAVENTAPIEDIEELGAPPPAAAATPE